MQWQPDHPAFQQLLKALLVEVPTIYIVGGVVRDFLLDRQVKTTDLDLMVDHSALPIARKLADRLGWAFYPLDEARDVARLVFTANVGDPLICDIARIRGGSLEGDLLMRDFTINAMAFVITRLGQVELLDICGGQNDLQQKIVRRVSAASLAADPVRLLRAIRFSAQLDFTLEEQTRLQIKRICSTVTLTSVERTRDELWKMLETMRPSQAIEALHDVGLLVHVLPEVAHLDGVAQSYPHFEDVLHHTLRVMQNAVEIRDWLLDRESSGTNQPSRSPEMQRWIEVMEPHRVELRHHFSEALATGRTRASWLVWHALLHDIGKLDCRSEEVQPNGTVRYRFFEHEQMSAKLTERRLSALRFSRLELALAQRISAAHMRPHLLNSSFLGQSISKRAKFRFFRDTQGTPGRGHSDGIDTLCLAIADYQAIQHRHGDKQNDYLRHAQELFAYIFDQQGFHATQQQPLIDGMTLINALDLSPGPQIGQILATIQEAQAAGEVETAEAALAYAATLLHNRAVTNTTCS